MFDTKTLLKSLTTGAAALAFAMPMAADTPDEPAPQRQSPIGTVDADDSDVREVEGDVESAEADVEDAAERAEADAEAAADRAEDAAEDAADRAEAEADAAEDRVERAADAAEDGAQDLVDTIQSKQDLSTLQAAIQQAGLTETLRGEGPYTILAPTNAAFRDLPAGTLSELLQPENKEQLANLLKHHVIEGEVTAEDIAEKQFVTTITGERLRVVSDDGKTMIGDAEVTGIDMPASNGLVHTIDTVLVPQGESSTENAANRDRMDDSTRDRDTDARDMPQTDETRDRADRVGSVDRDGDSNADADSDVGSDRVEGDVDSTEAQDTDDADDVPGSIGNSTGNRDGEM